jgi:adenine-specific DNA-methyltransferase
MDARAAAREVDVDVAYLDPPYNQHSYLANYHVWESLVEWDAPEVYGTACKRVDCRTRKSDFNSRARFLEAWAEVVRNVRARALVVSFSDEGFISRDTMEALLGERGQVRVLAHDYRRYVGAQIGIYDPAGRRVGSPAHLRNTEYLYIVT